MFKSSLKVFAIGLMAAGLGAFAQNAPQQAAPTSPVQPATQSAAKPAVKPTSKSTKHSTKNAATKGTVKTKGTKKASHKPASASHVKKAKTTKSSS